MHVKDKLAEAQRAGKPIFSFEYYVPKTPQVCNVSFSLSILRELTDFLGF